jgi:hypothetical protein
MEGVKTIIQMPVTWDGATRRKDKSVSLRFSTVAEVSNQDFAEMDRQMNSAGWLLFKPNESVDIAEVPSEDARSDMQKRPSQRLRGVIYRIWEASGASGDFEVFYRAYMEKVIDREKENLE